MNRIRLILVLATVVGVLSLGACGAANHSPMDGGGEWAKTDTWEGTRARPAALPS